MMRFLSMSVHSFHDRPHVNGVHIPPAPLASGRNRPAPANALPLARTAAPPRPPAPVPGPGSGGRIAQRHAQASTGETLDKVERPHRIDETRRDLRSRPALARPQCSAGGWGIHAEPLADHADPIAQPRLWQVVRADKDGAWLRSTRRSRIQAGRLRVEGGVGSSKRGRAARAGPGEATFLHALENVLTGSVRRSQRSTGAGTVDAALRRRRL